MRYILLNAQRKSIIFCLLSIVYYYTPFSRYCMVGWVVFCRPSTKSYKNPSGEYLFSHSSWSSFRQLARVESIREMLGIPLLICWSSGPKVGGQPLNIDYRSFLTECTDVWHRPRSAECRIMHELRENRAPHY